jgi:hypothetical protein
MEIIKKRGSKQKDLFVLSPEDREFFGRVSEEAYMLFSSDLLLVEAIAKD